MFREMLISHVGAGVAKARGRYGQVISKDDARSSSFRAVPGLTRGGSVTGSAMWAALTSSGTPGAG
jgi:hypothetical protein